MAIPPGASIVRIWTNDVAPAAAPAYAARLRDAELPLLRGTPGHVGSQLLQSDHDGAVRFTVISQWSADAESTMDDITGELSAAGRWTVERVLDGRPVDVVVGPAVSVESVADAPTTRRRDLVTVLALGVVAAVLVAWLGARDGDPVDPDRAADPGPVVSVATDEQAVAEVFVPWPDPPADHDPHVIGRPGEGRPVRAELAGVTLVYVNEQHRPTIIDLSTGDQRELDIAETRVSDTFLLENGRIVVTDELDPDFPLSGGNAFVFRVVLDGAVADEAGPVPTLCLTRDNGCETRAWTTGRFGDPRRFAESIDHEDASAAVASVIGSGLWHPDGRWTTFELDGGAGELRVPSPRSRAVVWTVVEPV